MRLQSPVESPRPKYVPHTSQRPILLEILRPAPFPSGYISHIWWSKQEFLQLIANKCTLGYGFQPGYLPSSNLCSHGDSNSNSYFQKRLFFGENSFLSLSSFPPIPPCFWRKNEGNAMLYTIPLIFHIRIFFAEMVRLFLNPK